MFQLTSALGHVSNSLDVLVHSYAAIAEWRATTMRLLSFEQALISVKSSAQSNNSIIKYGNGSLGPSSSADGPEKSGNFRMCISEIKLPDGQPLWKDLKLEIYRGQRVLISGPEGIGKSILFKALAGIWPYVDGCEMEFPVDDASEILFVPQRPALPGRCSLAEALSYPELPKAYDRDQLVSVLHRIGLEELLHAPSKDQAPKLDLKNVESNEDISKNNAEPNEDVSRIEEWPMLLSPGQQQRLAIGHVLLRKPRMLFLDEATSNVSKDTALELYCLLMEALPEGAVMVSISHDVETLAPLHDIVFTTEEQGATKILKPRMTGNA